MELKDYTTEELKDELKRRTELAKIAKAEEMKGVPTTAMERADKPAQDAHRCERVAAQPPPIMAQCEGSLEPHQGDENIHRIVQHRKENYP